ncbi:hypothetical protein ScPMuIL_008162 [Solemya velum]
MVLKRSKLALNTGNTIRPRLFLSNTSHCRQHGVCKFLLRVEPSEDSAAYVLAPPDPHTPTILDTLRRYVPDGGMRHTNNLTEVVFYSLNKRKRWLLPDLVVRGARELPVASDHFRLTMVERSLMPSWVRYANFKDNFFLRTPVHCRSWHVPDTKFYCHKIGVGLLNADCVRYTDSAGQREPERPNHTFAYFSDLRRNAESYHHNSLKCKTKGGRTTPIQVWDDGRMLPLVQMVGSTTVTAVPEVRYEIIRPRPYNSQKQFHHRRKRKYKKAVNSAYGAPDTPCVASSSIIIGLHCSDQSSLESLFLYTLASKLCVLHKLYYAKLMIAVEGKDKYICVGGLNVQFCSSSSDSIQAVQDYLCVSLFLGAT